MTDSSMTNLLEVADLGKRFGGFVALDNISLGVPAGERLGLIGPNGSGKSTLVNCICGTLQNEQGSVRFDGRSVEAHRALLVMQRAADAVDQRALAGAVRPDQAEPLAGGHVERNVLQRDEAAEAFAQVIDLEKVAHGTASGESVSTRRRPTKSSGLCCQ